MSIESNVLESIPYTNKTGRLRECKSVPWREWSGMIIGTFSMVRHYNGFDMIYGFPEQVKTLLYRATLKHYRGLDLEAQHVILLSFFPLFCKKASQISFIGLLSSNGLYWEKGSHNGPEETTWIKQGFGQHMEMGAVNGRRAGGG